MKIRFAALALAGTLALPMVATAQQGHGPGAEPRPNHRDAMHARLCEDLDARLAARLAWMEAKVKPTEAQRSAWDAFQRDSRAAAEPMRARCAAGQHRPAQGDLVAQLSQRETHMAAMLDAVRQTKAAVERLMPQLAEEQRKALAENFDGGRRMGHGMRRGHGNAPDGHHPAPAMPRQGG
jgi:hypothetical protein